MVCRRCPQSRGLQRRPRFLDFGLPRSPHCAVAAYVVSATLDRADWVNSTILRGPIPDEVCALKNQPGKDIVVTGSVTLVHSLLSAGVVDFVRLFVYPVVQGHGRRLFPDGLAADAQLLETKSFESGVVLMSYRLPSTANAG